MFNPLVDSTKDLSDNELLEKIQDLTKKYHQSRNPDVRMQIMAILDMFREEQTDRLAKQKEKNEFSDENDLDNLINID